MRRTFAIALLLLTGCDDGVDIIGHCELTSDAVRVLDDTEAVDHPALGLLDENLLVSWNRPPGAEPRTAFAMWIDRDLAAVSERFDLGWGLGQGTVWVRDGGSLRGQVWADPMHRMPFVSHRDIVHLWLMAPPPTPTAEFEPVHLDVGMGEDAQISLGDIGSPGLRGALPAVMTDRGFTAGVIAIPPGCEELGNYDTLFVYGSAHGEPTAVTWLPALCTDPPLDYPGTTFLPWFVDLDDTVGVVARVSLERTLHLIRIRPDGSVPPPRRIGSHPDRDWCTPNSGALPRAVALPGGRILFAECAQQTDPSRECHRLRIADRDGTDAHDAPWQLPCIESSGRTSLSLELVEIDGGAVVVWGERERTEIEIPAGTEVMQRVRAAIITPEGDRGSEIVTVTDAGATAFTGPFPLDFLISAASDGDRVAVGWQDARPSAPGFYARTLQCTVDP